MNRCEMNLDDVYRYLGFADQEPDTQTKETVAEVAEKFNTFPVGKGIYKEFPIEIGEEVVVSGTTLLLTGKNIKTLLRESTHCVLMAVTLGHHVDAWIRETQVRDMAKAVIIDACTSSLVEEYCNALEEEIKEKIGDRHLTDRFSPGYGDLPLSIQNTFSKVLETDKKLGLSVASNHLMAPKKSITAVLGVADTPQPMRIKGCGFCSLREHCEYRKRGATCGS